MNHGSHEEGARTSPRPGALFICGVDVMLGQDLSPHLIEVNDRPVGLSTIPILDGSESSAYQLGRRLVSRSPNVAIVLPEVYRLREHEGEVRRLEWHRDLEAVPPKRDVGDPRSEAFVGDINEIGRACESGGGALSLLDSREEVASHPGVLWNRSQRYVPADNVNDFAVRRRCLDKFTLCRPTIAALDRRPRRCVAARRALPKVPWPVIVVKPRFGSGSRDVVRMRLEDGDFAPRDEDVVLEEWIDSHTVDENGRPHRYDLRVIVVDGSAVAVVGRMAAAPASTAGGDGLLSWLTTTGRVVPVSIERGIQRPRLDCEQLRLPGDIASTVFRLAERAVAELVGLADLSEGELEPVRFTAIHRMPEDYEPVVLQRRGFG